MISAVILTKNEEKNIANCLESVLWCDETIVIDDDSTDKTVEIAKKHGAKVFQHDLDGDFAKQRNFALEKAKNEWVLFVDADERVSEKLKEEILHFQCKHEVQNDKVQGFYLKRIDTMWGRKLLHGEQGDTKLLRLAKKNSGKWVGKVHEVWRVNGITKTLENPLMHFPHPTLKEFLQEINFYTTIRAKELFEKGDSANWLDVIIYPKGKFLINYFFKLGFLDGTAGFIVAILMSLHSFLVRGKLWQLTEKK